MGCYYVFVGSNLEKNLENSGKTAFFRGGYGWIGEIQHGWIWPDWGLSLLTTALLSLLDWLLGRMVDYIDCSCHVT